MKRGAKQHVLSPSRARVPPVGVYYRLTGTANVTSPKYSRVTVWRYGDICNPLRDAESFSSGRRSCFQIVLTQTHSVPRGRLYIKSWVPMIVGAECNELHAL